MIQHLTLRLLGEATIEWEGQPLTTLPSRTAEALLFYLVCQDRPLARETLAELLWEERPSNQALANLRSILSSLRQVVGDFLLVTRNTVAFNHQTDYWLDAAAFQHQLTPLLKEPALTPAQAQQLNETLTLYRGHFLAGFHLRESRTFEEWVLLQQERWQRLAHDGLIRLVDYYLSNGQYAAGIPWAEKLLALDPYDEQARRQLMWLLARHGQRNAALQVYESGRALLWTDLGVEPTAATQAVYDRLRALSLPPPHHLPSEPTPLVGREEELAHLAHHLADPLCRLVTITGAGGIGKTRLALAAAQKILSHHPGQFLHGLFFVPLVSVIQTSYLPTAIAEAIGAPLQGATHPEQQLLAHLKERELLLILDNVEHLLSLDDTLITFLDHLLQDAPQVNLLLTSREPLNLREELLFDVTGLPFPTEPDVAATNTHYSAVALFWQNARRVQRHFQPDAVEQRAINRICALLEGTPLAIELASAAVRHTDCPTIWQKLRHNLDYLETTWRNVPSRHRSLRASYDYSWQLLTPDEQAVLTRLATFQGGFTTEAAQAVAAATPATLITLADKSLLRRTEAERYDMHPLIRQYAAEHLGEDAAALTRHSHYYLTLLAHQEMRLRTPEQGDAFALIGQEIENVRQAWERAISQADVTHLEPGGPALYRFYDTRGWLNEGETAFRKAAAALQTHFDAEATMPDAAAFAIAWLWGRVAWFRYQVGQVAEAKKLAEQSLATFVRLDARTEQARLLSDLAVYARRAGEYHEARKLFEASLQWRRELGDEWETARTLSNMANTVRLLGEFAAARELLLESVSILRAQGDHLMLANSLNNLGLVARAIDNLAEARVYYEECLVLRRELGDKIGLGGVLSNLSSLTHAQGDYASARRFAQESITLLYEIGNIRYVAYPLSVLARVARDEKDFAAAQNYFREALQLTWGLGYIPKVVDIIFELSTVKQAMGQPAEAAMMLAFVLAYEKLNEETRAAAQEMWAKVVAGLSPKEMREAQERGRGLTLETLVHQLLQTLKLP
jgi:predicted ATPase/DNA-binding SARP family transcriptional activator